MFASFHTASALIGACLALLLVLVIINPWAHSVPAADCGNKAVDPWHIQADLMRISGQRIPKTPEISKHSLMYAALIMEETSETFTGVEQALTHTNAYIPSVALDVKHRLFEVASQLHSSSLHIRNLLADMPDDWHMNLSFDQALEIFDGTTDVAVVNSGFALASGFPGAAGYLEVGDSNLSKKNPDTGVIDKTPDGKWIKGRDYRKPDLGKVLNLHCYAKPSVVRPLRAQA